MGELSKRGTRWTVEETSTARLMFRAGKRDADIAEAIGRTPRAVSGFLRRERDGAGTRADPERHRIGRDRNGSISKAGPPILEDQRQTIVEQDEAFQAAMVKAGYERHVVTEPGTHCPQRIQPPTWDWRSKVSGGGRGTPWE